MFRRFRSSSTSTLLDDQDHSRALRFVSAFEEQASGWFWETDAHGIFTYLSPQMRHVLEKKGTDPVGQPFTDIFRLDPNTGSIQRSIAFYLSTRSAFRDYPLISEVSGSAAVWAVSGRPKIDESGRFTGFVGSGSDLTEQRDSQLEVMRLAYLDGLTGLANRPRMAAWLNHSVMTRTSGFNPTALMMIDLDNFKPVNDTLGHQAGDELLKQVAQRLRRIVPHSDFVGRIGGDEFQVILARDSARTDVEQLAHALIDAVSQPYFIAGAPIKIGCSIGIAVAPEHGETATELVRNADLALYAAKDAGRGKSFVFADHLLVAAQHRKQMEDDLRDAIAKGELSVSYQPVISTATSLVSGYEALVRWNHPVSGAISPSDFIPVAEEAGLIEQIGEWVLRTAVHDAVTMPDGIRVAVNVSPIQFKNPKFAAIVANALASSGLDPARLELEITEGVFLNEDERASQMFRALKTLGVRLALDDFGTGYSSLGYLRTAPFDKIKIDKSFVRGAISDGHRKTAIIRAIVTLADAFGMETTAEGVEQQDEIAFVRDLGCSHIQGFVYGKAEPLDTVLRELAGQRLHVMPKGHEKSRNPRYKVLRTAKLIIGHHRTDVKVRNISTNGAMIEGSMPGMSSAGQEVLVELLEGQQWTGSVRWTRDGKAGLHFPRAINKELLRQANGGAAHDMWPEE
jgi:diguanylate cyclase (GGDEF)-like protein